ncbi:hypothetical protein [Galbibacter pacificus]|uniref:Uncharacterized protein n=1 Tax=Galbibacter pacificus TaxID=2996052 RepID=A0ABT6FR51_9FLAO|nr:hypothetical protein [Galbibacter pacificus]MDG3581779.1 hypothetical protein [Galbibacter pacificus]MDG3585747.1 hypothetical protein [Galbibacter pacificus]
MKELLAKYHSETYTIEFQHNTNYIKTIGHIKDNFVTKIKLDDYTNFYYNYKCNRLNKLENILKSYDYNTMVSKEFYFGNNYWYYVVVDKLNDGEVLVYEDMYYNYYKKGCYGMEKNPFQHLIKDYMEVNLNEL